MAAALRTHRIACIPGDGIGPEVIGATLKVLETLERSLKTFKLDFTQLPWGSDYYRSQGRYMPTDGIQLLKQHDAILFGAVGDKDVPDHISLWELLLAIRGQMQLYVNVRPVRTLPGIQPLIATPVKPIDWVIIRENSEGEYAGQGGRTHVGQPWECATEVAIYTRHGVGRIMRFAFETALSRPQKSLIVVTKSNAMRNGMVLWDEIATEISKDYPSVTMEKMLVDAMTVRMVKNPHTIDTIVGTNLQMDILSDLAAALAGSIGIASSSNIDPSRQSPSFFEPVHGSAFDITGKGVANPLGAIWSATEMLRWLKEDDAADRLMSAIEKVCEGNILTRDLGGHAGTLDVADAISKELSQSI
ncbi:isocitrate/isopropylmalate dehydrogenase [Aaosphaeria arxii CBS 175.79]|uniref:Isocitrate/isopropylmalate dehydrogenase n=1 Tax=Aaosphaeria arxii CBS 175.79 TaxID=1450172 RepID=A0A6A5YA13_9PLEO|nr:isocitrate/isopropylmalate dehydrogenase [Aaosphaeria arxii CBS 175.79]KAF2022412.1 isocitrate/isopropylmalate dehydrogenase [Aaosphaeria arxii CBS 175.79]